MKNYYNIVNLLFIILNLYVCKSYLNLLDDFNDTKELNIKKLAADKKAQKIAQFNEDLKYNEKFQKEIDTKLFSQEADLLEELDNKKQNRIDAQRVQDQKYNEKYQRTLVEQKANTQKVLNARKSDLSGKLKPFQGPIPLDPEGVFVEERKFENAKQSIGRPTNDSSYEIDELNRKSIDELNRESVKKVESELSNKPKNISRFGKFQEVLEGKFGRGGRGAVLAGVGLVAAGAGYAVYKGAVWAIDKSGKPIEKLADKDIKQLPAEVKKDLQKQAEKQGWSIGKQATVGGLAALGLTGLSAGAYDWYKQSQKKDYKGFGNYSKKVYGRIKNQIKRIFS